MTKRTQARARASVAANQPAGPLSRAQHLGALVWALPEVKRSIFHTLFKSYHGRTRKRDLLTLSRSDFEEAITARYEYFDFAKYRALLAEKADTVSR